MCKNIKGMILSLLLFLTVQSLFATQLGSEMTDSSQHEATIDPQSFALSGKRVLVLGDSKAEGVGNKVGNEYRSWAYYLQEKYGCKVTNAAVGGTHLTPTGLKPQNSINGLGAYSFVQAWKTGDYSLVEASIEWAHNSKYGTRWDHVEEIVKNSTANDYDIICIAAGTNDWNNKLRVIGNWEDTNPIYNYTVALRGIIQTLQALNPKLYILVVTPTVRQIVVSDPSTYSDNYQNPNSGLYLYDVAEALVNIAHRCGAEALNAYYEMGFNLNNWTSKYSNDGTHPNEAGYRVMADKIGEFICKSLSESASTGFHAQLNSKELWAENIQGFVISDLWGHITKKEASDSPWSENLPDGLYIVNGKKYLLKGRAR